ncbi:uncharacterized protein LOC119726899 [Patiria miniata]|uniref:Uncharacterized protein n=1 Tax=Patiria miniata TaxID=46514 RepID=A0A913ZSD3_PATMI|nr:uncharacterized protein LOC119726899 [Patiria miniata]
MDFEEGERSLGRLILEEPKAAVEPSPRPGRSCVEEKWELKTEEQSRGAAKQSPRPGRSGVKEKWELKTEEQSMGAAKQSPRPGRSGVEEKWELKTEEQSRGAAKQSPRPGRSIVKEKWELKTEEQSRGAAKQSPRPGRTCVKEKWKLKTEIKNFELSVSSFMSLVAALSNNQILALALSVPFSGERETLFTVIIPKSHQESPIIRPQINGLTNVRCIAVSKDNKLFVIDGQKVKVFSKQHQLHQFKPGKWLHSQPTCLAVDDSNLIAVGYDGKNEISLHNPDGSRIRRLPAPMIGDYLTMHNHHLIYTNWLNKRLVCVDYYGASVFSVDMTSNMQEGYYPNGVCCNSDASIYVAVFGHPTGDILHYSPNGKYIGCVINGCSDPRGITFTLDGDLVVAAGESVQVYHRV